MTKRKLNENQLTFFDLFGKLPGIEPSRGPLIVSRGTDSTSHLIVGASSKEPLFPAPGKRLPQPKPLTLETSARVAAHKCGHRILFKPCDILGAVRFEWLRKEKQSQMETALRPNISDWDHEDPAKPAYARAQELHAEYGLALEISPTLRGWLKKYKRRKALDLTPLPLNVLVDDRPLFDRVEAGMVLDCYRHFYDGDALVFKAGHRYRVVDAIHGDLRVLRLDRQSFHIKRQHLVSDDSTYEWTAANGPLESYFRWNRYSPPDSKATVPERYTHLVTAYQRKLEALNLPLYEHVQHDAPIIATKRSVLIAYDMRLGKTSLAISYALLRNAKRVAVISGRNPRLVWSRKEMKRLGLPESEYKEINRLSDTTSPARFHLYTDTFLKFHKVTKSQDFSGNCPRCSSALYQWRSGEWVTERGFRCRHCHYVDFELAQHAQCETSWRPTGRTCPSCGLARETYVPAIYRRVKDKYTLTIVDEAHNYKAEDTLCGRAVRAFRSRNRAIVTGTPMPNDPSNIYYLLTWVARGGSHLFPYRWRDGYKDFLDDFTEFLSFETTREDGTHRVIRKMLPYLKDPAKFWALTQPLLIRRHIDDPLVQKSVVKPRVEMQTIEVTMTPNQAGLYLAALKGFEETWEEMLQKEKEGKITITMANTLPVMMDLRLAATCPHYFNQRLGRVVYSDLPGGAKMHAIDKIVSQSIARGLKIGILSNFVSMQDAVAAAYAPLGVVRFRPEWSDDKRQQAIDDFTSNPNLRLFVAGTLAVREGVNIPADVLIVTDLLWSPGIQLQAQARFLTPSDQPRTIQVYTILAQNTIDLYMRSACFVKLAAAEEAWDRKPVYERPERIEIKDFVCQILAQTGAILELYESQTGDSDGVPGAVVPDIPIEV